MKRKIHMLDGSFPATSPLMQDGSLDALKVEVGVNGENRIITLFGGKGGESKGEYFSLGNLNFKLSYGSKYFTSLKTFPYRLTNSIFAIISFLDWFEFMPLKKIFKASLLL